VPLVFSDRERLDASPSSGESLYSFLDRVAGPVWDRIRQLIEDWASDYSPANREQLVGRLKSRRDIDVTGAYWELLLYYGLSALGFAVTPEPEIPGTTKRPDFLVEGHQCSFYLEAKVLGDDLADRRRDKQRQKIERELNARVRSDDFIVRVQFAKDGAQPIPIGKLAADTRAWLDGLDLADVHAEIGLAGLLGAPPLIWQDERSGWSITLAPMRKRGNRIVGVIGPHFSWIDDRTPIRKALYEKSHKYGDELNKPLVVALSGIPKVLFVTWGQPGAGPGRGGGQHLVR